MDIPQRATTLLQEYAQVTALLDNTALNAAAETILSANRIFTLAAGRSRCVLQMFAMRLVQTGLNVHTVGDPTTPALKNGELLICASGSGETRSVLTLATVARAAGARILVLSASPESALAKLADELIIIPTRELQSSQLLGSCFETSLLLCTDLLLECILEKSGKTPADLAARHANIE